jgi:hypothetical protein
MSAQRDDSVEVFYCIVCGPVIRFLTLTGHITMHHAVDHPPEVLVQPEDEQVHAQ